jgi:hypothetical protein
MKAADTGSGAASRTGSRLFRCIEDLQGELPWGSFLDAGTGTNSLRWITSLETERWTAVTAAQGHAVQVRSSVGDRRRPQDNITVGNWSDPALLAGERFDTVLADYLIGAVEGFAPYYQPYLLPRLRQITGRRLYIVGLEPYVASEPEEPAGKLVWEIGRFRDACLLLAGERPYREYPAQWVADHLEGSSFRIIAAHRFPNRYKPGFVNSQIDMCALRLDGLADRALAVALQERGEHIRERALAMIAADGGLKHGFDYILAAEPCA